MNSLVAYTLLGVVFLLGGKSLAELEQISINAPGDVPEVVAEDLAKRYGGGSFKPKVYARGGNQFGGSDYTVEQQRDILVAHNEHRKGVEPTASNMDEMVWSVKLASMAQQWSDRCIYEHPSRGSNPEYRGIGQNLYIKYLDYDGDNPPSPPVQPVTLWNNEDKDYQYEIGSCNEGKVCGHYTQLVWASTAETGCGITFCESATTNGGTSFPNAWLVTCNYSPGGNYRGQKPYKAGNPCGECPNGFCKDGLCSDCDPSEPGCECMLECQNCGVLNSQTCTCQCSSGFHGVACEKSCKDSHRYCGANPGWPSFWCNNYRFPFVDMYCPKMCGHCTVSEATECS